MYHVILSGGLDSTAALARVIARGDAVRAVSFDYGQRHRRELHAAADVAGHYGIEHKIVDLAGLLSGSALIDGGGEVPTGRYDHPSMSATVVNGRNLLFASAAIAQARPGDVIVFGVHAGDHPIYADCRPEFWWSLHSAAEAYKIGIETPWLLVDKSEIVRRGNDHDAPLGLTWSCYVGGDLHCGRCGTCVERAEAFDLAGVPDPTEYADPDYWRQALTEPA